MYVPQFIGYQGRARSSWITALRPPSEFLEAHGLSRGQSCTKCGCEIGRNLCGEAVCVRCYPACGYHSYSGWTDISLVERDCRAIFTM
jgi:hypothetical protein